MRQTISITIEHIVAASNRSYEQVKEALEARLGVAGDIDEFVRRLAAVNASWDQVTQAVENRLGTSGFSIVSKVEHGVLLSLAGNPGGWASMPWARIIRRHRGHTIVDTAEFTEHRIEHGAHQGN